jgi:hypothetical protein
VRTAHAASIDRRKLASRLRLRCDDDHKNALLRVRRTAESDAELVLDAVTALDVGREALALLGEIARAVVAFRRGVVRQIENPPLVALGPFLAADGQHPISECIEILLIDAGQLCRHVNRVLEFKTADGVALAFSVPKGGGTAVLEYFQDKMPYGLAVPDVPRSLSPGFYRLEPGGRSSTH